MKIARFIFGNVETAGAFFAGYFYFQSSYGMMVGCIAVNIVAAAIADGLKEEIWRHGIR